MGHPMLGMVLASVFWKVVGRRVDPPRILGSTGESRRVLASAGLVEGPMGCLA